MLNCLINIWEGMKSFRWAHFLGFIFLSCKVELTTPALLDILHLTQKSCLLSARDTHYPENFQGVLRRVKCWTLGVRGWVEGVWLGTDSLCSSRALPFGHHQPSTPEAFSSPFLLAWLPLIQNRVYFRCAHWMTMVMYLGNSEVFLPSSHSAPYLA